MSEMLETMEYITDSLNIVNPMTMCCCLTSTEEYLGQQCYYKHYYLVYFPYFVGFHLKLITPYIGILAKSSLIQ